MISRRQILACLCSIATLPLRANASHKILLADIPLSVHESAMREAIKVAQLNPDFPFGAVIINAISGKVVARGVNTSRVNPTFHGEIVCMNNYIEKFGNKGWSDHILYTTGEPCPMCMAALTWADIQGVVYGSSIETISRSGIGQINISAQSVIEATDFKKPELLGGVLTQACDELFTMRKRKTDES